MKPIHSSAGKLPQALLLIASALPPMGGCAQTSPVNLAYSYPRTIFRDPDARSRFETDFSGRSLDPIEGFWRSRNEYIEGTAVVCRTDPAENEGFALAAYPIESRLLQPIPMHPPRHGQVLGRWKPSSTPGVYFGEVLMVRGNEEFWLPATCELLDPTTVQVTYETTSVVYGGRVQKGYLVGPGDVLNTRLTLAERMRKGVRVDVPDASLAVGGSAFLVAPDLAITNHHVIAGRVSITCYGDGWSRAASLVAQDDQNDLALLKLSESAPAGSTPLPLGDTAAARQGERVYGMGYPLTDALGTSLHVHEGILSSLTGLQGRASEFQIEMSLNPGSSGGPILNRFGQVIGVATSKLSPGYALQRGTIPEGITFAVKVDMLRPLLATAGRLGDVRADVPIEEPLPLDRVTEMYGASVLRVESHGESSTVPIESKP
ncbi:MAG: S1C family serine protease [Pirellulaceae bacterium]